jgi:hypothetical protein
MAHDKVQYLKDVEGKEARGTAASSIPVFCPV